MLRFTQNFQGTVYFHSLINNLNHFTVVNNPGYVKKKSRKISELSWRSEGSTAYIGADMTQPHSTECYLYLL